MNIIWKKPDETLAVTSVPDGEDPASHAALLQERGDIPADWVVVATNHDQFPECPMEAWRWENGQIIAITPPAPVPASVTMRQGREALIRRGYFAAVDSYFKALPDTTDGLLAKNEWEKSQVIERHRPSTLAMLQMLGLTPAQGDELFQYAATL